MNAKGIKFIVGLILLMAIGIQVFYIFEGTSASLKESTATWVLMGAGVLVALYLIFSGMFQKPGKRPYT